MRLGADDAVLVTGAAGFIGRDVVACLLGAGYRVTAFVRPARIGAFEPAPRLAVAPGDMRDPASLERALAGARVVVHLAARKSDEPDSEAVNVGGAAHLVAACRAAGVRRVIHVSTQSVKLRRPGTYGRTKAEAEAILVASGLDVTTLRPSVVYGPDIAGVFARMRHALARLPVVPVVGDGRWRSRPIHVRDVSRAVLACIERDATIGATYDLGGPDEVTMDEFLGALGDALGVRRRLVHVPAWAGLLAAHVLARLSPRPFVTVSNVRGSTQDTHCDPSRATAELGLAPVGLREGLERLLDDEARARTGGAGPVLRVAVVGLGKMGLFHAALLRVVPGVRLAGLVDTDARLRATVRSMGLDAPFASSLGALLEARPLHAVVVCTPTAAHAEAVEACLARGLHVLVEKPLAETGRRAAELAALAGRAGVTHAVGYHLAWHPLFERARALVRAGVLGEVTAYRGALRHGEVLGPKRGWMFDPAAAGGGLVRNTACHLLFLLEWFFGPPARVTAKTERLHSVAVEDALTATLEYASGLTGEVEASWSVPGKPVMEVDLLVMGRRGALLVDGTDLWLTLAGDGPGFPAGRHRLHVSDCRDPGVYDLAPEAGGAAYYRQDRAFVGACLGGGDVRTGFDVAARVERVIDALYRAAETGKVVDLGEGP